MRRDKDTTRENLLAAIERIKTGAVTNKVLKTRKNVKLNKANVEKEAGLGSGALRHHGDVVDKIEGVSEDGWVSKEKYEALKKKGVALRVDKRAALTISDTYKKDADDAQDALKNKLAAQHQLVTALFHKVPIEEREELMKKISNTSTDGKVTRISDFRK